MHFIIFFIQNARIGLLFGINYKYNCLSDFFIFKN